MFLEVLKETAFHKCNLTLDQPLLVGVSGGADSLALMIGLDILGFSLEIAHLDHSIRSESKMDADFVENLARSKGLGFVRGRIDVEKAAESEGQSIEEAARHVRYQFLFAEAQRINAQAVVVGHHADDQVETVLMHILRGTALPGLTGMAYKNIFHAWDANIPLVRPLLGIWRNEIDAFLKEVGISPRIDKTNRDITYLRNKLRHVLIPQLQEYNPNIKQVVWRMSDVLREEDKLLIDLTEEAWEECKVRQNQEQVILYHLNYIKNPKAIQRRLLRKAISQLRPDLRDVGYEIVDQGIKFANDPSQIGEMDLVARLNVAKIEDYLIIKSWGSDLPDWKMPLLPNQNTRVMIDIDKPAALRHGWYLETNVIDKVSDSHYDEVKTLRPEETWLDYDLLKKPLILRSRKAGDRWQPLGMLAHTQKLKDFFINEKIPEHLRDVWPLVCSGDDIAWVVGLRPSEIFKITNNTKRILHLRLIRKVV